MLLHEGARRMLALHAIKGLELGDTGYLPAYRCVIRRRPLGAARLRPPSLLLRLVVTV